MKLKEFMLATGATERQIEYWAMVMPLHEVQPNRGSGYPKEYKPEVVDRVKLFVDLSKAFHNMFPVDLMVEIFDNYERGVIRVIPGVFINWAQRTDYARSQG